MTRLTLILVFCALAACGASPKAQAPRAFHLNLMHPSANANYIRVAPVPGGAGLPADQSIISPSFSLYLREQTGCVRDASRPTAVLGNRSVPAGYMVPITCP